MSPGEIGELLASLAGRLIDAVHGEPFTPAAAYDVGTALVAAHFTDAASLGRTIAVMGTRLADAMLPTEDLAQRVADLQGALAAGYTHALRRRTLAEQEAVGRAAQTALGQTYDALRASERRLRAVFAGAGVGIGITDLNGAILEINRLLADMLGVPGDALHGIDLLSFMDAGAAERFRTIALGEDDHVRFEQRFHRGDGHLLWVDLSISLIRDEDGTPRCAVAMARDITQRHLLADRLRHQATHDPLTELPNRTLFFERLGAVFANARPDDRIGLCYLDLDGFKIVNTLGHDVGDQLLVAVAARLSGCVDGMGHLAARMGGDKFVVLVASSLGTDQMTGIADAILAALRPPFRVAGHRLSVSASIGIVECPVRGLSQRELMKAADITLFWAKSDGKARWALFDAERHAQQVARYAMAAALPVALERGEFFLHYQPLVRLEDGIMTGLEALVRWRHPRLGVLGPDQFITLAEETGLIVPLGRWVLAEACRQAQAWQASHKLFISVNLAVRQAHDPELVDDVARVLDLTGLDAGALQLELTESAVMGTAGEPLDALRRLADMGVRVAIDDFGTGYSNLAYLRHLPVHALKLAGPFVEGLRGDDPVSEQIVATLVALAHTLGLSVTAEGVEHARQVDQLRALGCDLVQGWYFARPAPASRITGLLETDGQPPYLPLPRHTE